MLIDSLNATAAGRQPSLSDAMSAARERRRHEGRSATRRAVGSTLLLKGLEADYTILLDMEGLSAAHVYVALTRGTRGMLVFSRNQWLGRT
jgi:DNA helicase-2/ATP-dependent DNA helicase PcrA